jgi:hypothetical protein
MSILCLTPKLHYFRFQNYNTHPDQNDVVLAIYLFFIIFKMKIGGGSNLAKMGGPATPFLANGCLKPPPRLVWGWSNHPHTQVGGLATLKRPKEKKEKGKEKWVKIGFEGGQTTFKGLAGIGWPKPPQALEGGLATPKSLKPILTPFFLGGGGWPNHSLGHGGGSTILRPTIGVAPTTSCQKMGWPDHPILAKGVVGATPDFLLLLLLPPPPPPPDFHLFLKKKFKN